MMGLSQRFLAWPSGQHLRFTLLISLGVGLWFGFVYGACDAITARRDVLVSTYLDWELELPFVPEAVLFYVSTFFLFFLVPFILRKRREIMALAATLNVVIFAAGIGFLILPARPNFTPPDDLGTFAELFRLADRLNLTYNDVPSLHVALSVTCIAAFATEAFGWGRIALWAWAVAITISTLLTRQHHVLDVLCGWVLALISFRAIYVPRRADAKLTLEGEPLVELRR